VPQLARGKTKAKKRKKEKKQAKETSIREAAKKKAAACWLPRHCRFSPMASMVAFLYKNLIRFLGQTTEHLGHHCTKLMA
jgi:hypothetical protein